MLEARDEGALVERRPKLGWIAGWILAAAACGPGGGENHPPVADAGGPVTVALGEAVVLHGACTDPDVEDRAGLALAWSLEVVPEGSALTTADLGGRSGPDVFFNPDRSGAYRLVLVCTDPRGARSAPDLAEVTVQGPPPDRAPVVDAGPGGRVELGEVVRLSGSAYDPDGDPLSLTWRVSRAPTGAGAGSADLQDAGTLEPTFTPDVEGSWTFELSADDGRGGSASDTVSVEVVPVERLAGTLDLEVLDAETLAPVAGAEVWIGGSKVSGVSGDDGTLVLADPALTGQVTITVASPRTVAWDHDGEPGTPTLTVPVFARVSVTAVARPSLTVLLPRTEAGRTARGRGRVTGAVPTERFDALPKIRPFFSLAGARISGQLRVVLVAPLLPPSAGATLDPGRLFAQAPSSRVPLPGNMTTDDPFLNDNAALFDRPAGPNGEPPFTRLDLDLPAGKARLLVLAGIATVDMARLLPLLTSGAPAGALGPELGIVMGAIDLTTLSVGVIEVDVPDGGEVDLGPSLVDPSTWIAYQEVPVETAGEIEELCDEGGACVALERLRLFPDDRLDVSLGALPADPRVVSALPATAPYEVFCPRASGNPTHCDPPKMVDLPVPADTHTDVPYAVEVALLQIPEGNGLAPEGALAVVGYRFARAPGLGEATTRFALPPLEGPLDGLSYAVAVTATRRASSRAFDGAFFFQPGASVEVREGVGPGAQVVVGEGGRLRAFPSLAGAAPLQVEVLFDVEDPTAEPPQVRSAWAMARGAGDARAGPDLPAHFTLTLDGGGDDLITLRLSVVDRSLAGADGVPVTRLAWEVLYPAGTTTLDLPAFPVQEAPLPAGAEVFVEAAAWRIGGAFSYRILDPTLLSRHRLASVRDTFAWRVP